MAQSVFKSESGRRAVLDSYEKVLAQAASTFPHRRRIVETPFGRIHIFEAGDADGSLLLLLHGTASNSAAWMAELPRWSRHFRVIAADIPGEPGLSGDRRLTLADEESADWLGSLLDVLCLPRVRIVGMSLGGWLGLRFATRFPERIEALSLISTSGIAPQKRSFIFKALPLAILGDWGLRRINKLVCGGVELPEDAEAFMMLVGRHFRPLLEPIPVFKDAELQHLQMPIQFYYGAKDVLLHAVASVRRLKTLLPRAEVFFLKDHGHVIIDKTDEVLSFLLRTDSTVLNGRNQPAAV